MSLGDRLRALQQLPEVAEAVALWGELWVALRPGAIDRRSALQESLWQTIFDDTFSRPAAREDATLHSAVWGSSYTGAPIPTAEIEEWIAATVDNVLALRPRRVLEVGCGDGQLLFRIAPRVEHYLGTDFSARGLAELRASLDRHHAHLRNVELAQLSALEIGTVGTAAFDTIVINSVAQYFPNFAYFSQVLERAMELLRPGGALFLGDLRSLQHHEAYVTSVELARPTPHPNAGAWRAALEKRASAERELLIHPGIVHQLPWSAQARLKRSHADNELNRFRFDLTVFKSSREPLEPARTLEWTGLDALHRQLAAGPQLLRVRGVPNSRVCSELHWLKRLADPVEPFTREATPAPETIAAPGHQAWLGFAEDPSALELCLVPEGVDGLFRGAAPSSELANIPSFAQLAARAKQALLGAAGAPVHAVPSFPRTAAGQLDEQALVRRLCRVTCT